MRKIYFLAIALLCLSFLSNAQISKGSAFLGGSVGFSSNSLEQSTTQQPTPVQENKQSGFSISPQFGKAIGTNRILGVSLNYSNNSSEQMNGTNKSKTESSGYGGGVFYRRYYSMSQRFYLFGEAGLGVVFGSGETTITNGATSFVSGESNSKQFSVSVTPGLSFAASQKLFLEASLNNLFSLAYNSGESTFFNQQGTLIQTSENKSFSASANANGFSGLSVGLRWILASKR